MSGRRPEWAVLLVASGAASLVYEVVWMRRLSLVLGAGAIAGALVLACFMAGLALGSALSTRLPRSRPLRTYALLEMAAAGLALLFPSVLGALEPLAGAGLPGRAAVAGLLLLPPATLLGATWPLLARVLDPRSAAGLYAANTAGAVAGVLLATFALLPVLGVRGTEVAAAALGLLAAAVAVFGLQDVEGAADAAPSARPPLVLLVAVGAAGLAALGLEVVWLRLAAVGLGATVQTFGIVLATFLAAVAAGAWLGRRWPADPRQGLGGGLAAVGLLALLGAAGWGWLPYGVAAAYRLGGAEVLLPASAVLAALAMGGAPAASGLAFSCAVRALGPGLERGAGPLYASNTVGAIAGSLLAGLVVLPGLEVHGAVVAFALVAAGAGALVVRRPGPLLAVGALALLLPGWDARLYAVGVHLRVSDFADPSAAAVRRFADEGWDLLLYDQGMTGAVAVGRSRTSGNVWLSVNGKVDASTGRDMPTQRLSGLLPVAAARAPANALVVGLASGVTAGAVLEDPRITSLTLVEIEPAVVRASVFFDHVNGRPLDDPRTRLVLEDARGFLRRTERRFDVIVSEPSNPWITGVSSLFTEEYWELARDRLAEGGVMCQWLQLYGMGPAELRALVRTFSGVFPDTWLFETVEGSDVLLLGGVATLPDDLPIAPRLDPEGVRRLGGEGWRNTDDRPRVEWEAPRWLHYATVEQNLQLIAEAAGSSSPAPIRSTGPDWEER